MIHGDGRQTRDFVFVDDAVDALARTVDRGDGLVINIGTGLATPVRDLWQLIAPDSAITPRLDSGHRSGVGRLAVSATRASKRPKATSACLSASSRSRRLTGRRSQA